MMNLFVFESVAENIAAFHQRQKIWLIVGAVVMGLFLLFFLLFIRKMSQITKMH